MKTLIATAFPVEYALPVMVSAALMSRLILIPVRRFLTGQGCGVNARMRTAEATGIWAMAVAAMLFCLAQAPFTERLYALLMSGFLLQLGVCDAASGWLPRQMTVAFLVAGGSGLRDNGTPCRHTGTWRCDSADIRDFAAPAVAQQTPGYVPASGNGRPVDDGRNGGLAGPA
ncbi:hypothetical protein JN65_002780 [Salmonella enterica]|nr:hypothetical protein [Salmonella enterica]